MRQSTLGQKNAPKKIMPSAPSFQPPTHPLENQDTLAISEEAYLHSSQVYNFF